MKSTCIDPRFLDLGTNWWWVVSFTPRHLYPMKKSLGNHWIGGYMGPRAGFVAWRIENSWPYQDLNSEPSVVHTVTSRYIDCAGEKWNDNSKQYNLCNWYNIVKLAGKIINVTCILYNFDVYNKQSCPCDYLIKLYAMKTYGGMDV
jgi:hypothetical protein